MLRPYFLTLEDVRLVPRALGIFRQGGIRSKIFGGVDTTLEEDGIDGVFEEFSY